MTSPCWWSTQKPGGSSGSSQVTVATSTTWWVKVDGWQVAGDENDNSRCLFFFRLSALMADGWLPWRWTALFVRGISPLEGKEVVLHRLIFGNQTFWSDYNSWPCSLVDCFLVAMAPVSVSMSPTGDFLATSHVDSLGIYLWSASSRPCWDYLWWFSWSVRDVVSQSQRCVSSQDQ